MGGDWRGLGQGTQGGLALGLLFGHGGWPAGVAVVGPWAAGKLFASKAAIRWLTQGLTMPAGSKAAAALGGRIVAQLQREPLMEQEVEFFSGALEKQKRPLLSSQPLPVGGVP